MLAGLLKMSGFLILRIIYGKDSKKLEEFGFGIPMALSLGFIFWLMSLLFLSADMAAGDTWLCIVFAIGYPLGLLIWRMLVRRPDANAVNDKAVTQGPFVDQEDISKDDVDVPPIKYCRKCGGLLTEDSKTCSRCGRHW